MQHFSFSYAQDQNCVFSVSVEGSQSEFFTAEPSSARSFALVQLRVRNGSQLDYEKTQTITFNVSRPLCLSKDVNCLDITYCTVYSNWLQFSRLDGNLWCFRLFHSRTDDRVENTRQIMCVFIPICLTFQSGTE